METRKKPDWLKIRLPQNANYKVVYDTVKKYNLHTICTSGKCPNLGECWDRKTATMMILGDICTRSCKFCAVKTGRPKAPDLNEPTNIANAVKLLELKHCVLTSVDRDDLEDGGANIWAQTVLKIKELNPKTTLETLIPDFNASKDLIKLIIDAKPEVISHNLETVERLTSQVRSKAQYRKSLEVLRFISASGINAKSGIMTGIGETFEEVLQTMDDVLETGCKIFTIGQYLQATRDNMSVKEYITPETFEKWRLIGLEKGFKHIESSPLVRSSYHAEKHV